VVFKSVRFTVILASWECSGWAQYIRPILRTQQHGACCMLLTTMAKSLATRGCSAAYWAHCPCFVAHCVAHTQMRLTFGALFWCTGGVALHGACVVGACCWVCACCGRQLGCVIGAAKQMVCHAVVWCAMPLLVYCHLERCPDPVHQQEKARVALQSVLNWL
jgi:hypothetical protein